MNNEPVAWAYIKDGDFYDAIHPDEHAKEEGSYDIPLYTHPAKTQLNLVNVVKNHIEDLQNCVKLFRSAEMDGTADEMEVAIKELEDAINTHPAKTENETNWKEMYWEMHKLNHKHWKGLKEAQTEIEALKKYIQEKYDQRCEAILKKASEK